MISLLLLLMMSCGLDKPEIAAKKMSQRLEKVKKLQDAGKTQEALKEYMKFGGESLKLMNKYEKKGYNDAMTYLNTLKKETAKYENLINQLKNQ